MSLQPMTQLICLDVCCELQSPLPRSMKVLLTCNCTLFFLQRNSSRFAMLSELSEGLSTMLLTYMPGVRCPSGEG